MGKKKEARKQKEAPIGEDLGDEPAQVVYKTDAGPVQKRRCRDIFWFLLFFVFWIGMVIISIFSFENGNTSRLIFGIDSAGNLCGDGDYVNKSFIYYFDMTNFTQSYSRCIEACPPDTIRFDQTDDYLEAICKYNVTVASNEEVITAATIGDCVYPVFQSTDFIGRCIPTFVDSNFTLFENDTTVNLEIIQEAFVDLLNDQGISFNIYRDLYYAYPWILCSMGASLILSWAWLLLLELCSGVMVWVSIILVVVVCFGCGGYAWYEWHEIWSGNYVPTGTELSPLGDFAEQFSSYLYNEWTFLVVAIVLSLFGLVIFLAVIFLRTRIMLAIQIIKCATRAVRSMPLLTLFPIVKFAMLFVALGYCVLIMLNLATTASTITNFGVFGQNFFEVDYLLEYLQLYVLFGFLWTWNFLLAVCDTTIAGAIATWYWTRNKKKLPSWIVTRAFGRTLRYHLGSLAFGSLIIALVQFIRYLLIKLEKKVKGKENPFLQFLFKCLHIFFLCLERFLKFLNNNAYIEIAVYGYGFCKAAKWAFQLLLRNALRVVTVSKVGDFLLFTGKVTIAVLSGVIGNYLISYFSEEPAYWVLPVCLIVLLAYAIAYVFMAVLEMAIDTIFLSFCEDSERNDGSKERPYFMVKKLQRFIDQNAKKSTDLGK